MKHKHAELIKAWADGAIIQYKVGDYTWVDSVDNDPSWSVKSEYRIKPKPDVILYGHTDWIRCNGRKNQCEEDSCKFTFDGETGKLKSAEVI